MNEVVRMNSERSEPFLPEAEQMVLGCMMMSGDAIAQTVAAGGEDLFRDDLHRLLCGEIIRRSNAAQMHTPVALKPWADAQEGFKELGGAGYLGRMAGIAVSSKLLPNYIDILADMARKRRLLVTFQSAQQDIYAGQDRADEIAARVEGAMVPESTTAARKPVSAMAAATDALRDSYSAHQGNDGGAIKTGFDCIDGLTGGLYPNEMTVLGGRPSMGKTALALSIALNVARNGAPVTFCSFEMSPKAMMMRAISEATTHHSAATSYFNIRQGTYGDRQGEAIKAATNEVAQLPLNFLTQEYREIGSFLAGLRQADRSMGGLGLVVVDYVQLLTSPARSRYEQITDISLGLKQAAMQLEVPVLALSQLSRAVEQRDDKRPVLSDLRESGQIEQDADAVMFCYRHEYYLERMEPKSGTERHEQWQSAMQAAHRKIDVIMPKNRQGAVGTARMNCNLALNKFWEN